MSRIATQGRVNIVSGSTTGASPAVFSPASVSDGKIMLQALDGLTPVTRTVNGTVRVIDDSRGGTPRQMQPGRCYNFAGVSDRVATAARVTTDDLATMTISAWVKITNTAANRVIAGEWESSADDRSWIVYIDATEKVVAGFSSAGSDSEFETSAAAVTVGQWVHVAVTYDGAEGEVVIYIDGVAETFATSVSDLFQTSEPFVAGASNVSTTLANPFVGQMIDLRMYETVLTSSEISEISAMSIGSAAIGPTTAKLWWKGDEGGTVTTARNSGTAGDAANGTITAAAIASFHNATINDKFSFQNEVGFTDDTAGATAAYLPRDEANPSQDVLDNAIQHSGQAPHDPILSSKCLTLNGTNEYVTQNNITMPTISSTIDITMWVNGAASPDIVLAFGSSSSASPVFDIAGGTDNSKMAVFFRNDASSSIAFIDSTATVFDSTWHKIRVVYNGTDTLTYYVDDVLDSTHAISPTGALTVNRFTIGALVRTSVSGYFDGKIADVSVTVGGVLQGHWPLQSGIYGYQDVSGNQRHGTPTITSETTAWANQQNKVDTLVTDGATIATRYSGTGEYYAKGSRLTSGALSALSVAVWVYADSIATKNIMGEFETTGSQKGWQLSLDSGGTLRFTLASDGSTVAIKATTPTLTAKTWTHIAAVYASSAVTFYINGAAVSSTVASGTIPATIHDGTAAFEIGAADGGATPWAGQLSGAIVEATEWSAATVAEIDAGTIPASTWRWRDGNGTEHNNALTALTENGTPDRIIVPAGIMPVTVGPGVLMPGQSLDLGGGQANSPYAQQAADLLSDMTYDQGDDDEANLLFARVRSNSEGDDRIIVSIPGLTGAELSNMQDYTS